MAETWRSQLTDLVARAVAESGPSAVQDALAEHSDALSEHPDAPVEPFRPGTAILALVPCEAGTLGVLVQPEGRVSVHLGRTAAAVLDQVRESVEPDVIVEGGAAVPDRDHLDRAGFAVPAWFSGSGFSEADLLGACAAVLAAAD